MNAHQKLRFLYKKGKSIFKKVRKKDTGIIGFHIAKKQSGGIEARNYSLVFHVVKKIGKNKLSKSRLIPETVILTFPDGTKKTIKTDVRQAGKFKLHAGIAGTVSSRLSPPNSLGTTALFVTDDEVRALMMTNYHVVAENLMNRGQSYYLRDPGNTARNVTMRVPGGPLVNGCLEEGRIALDIDVAFVLLPGIPPSPVLNQLPNGTNIQARVTANPTPASFRFKNVVVFSIHNPLGIRSVIRAESAAIGEGNSHYEDVVALDRVTQGGDSGSLVLLPGNLALGIIFGADQLFSYAIPFYKITNFKNFRIL